MTTTQAVADRINAHALQYGRVGIPLPAIIALVQVLAQVLVACFPQPETAAAYLRGDDRPWFPRLTLALRRRRIINAVADHYHGPGHLLDDVTAAVLTECARVTPDVVADLYEDQKK